MGTSVRDGPRLFLLFGKNYCFIQKLNFLLNTFQEMFSNFRSDRLDNATTWENLMLKSISTPGRSIFQSGIPLKTRFSQLLRYFHVCVCSLFKLMQLVCQCWSGICMQFKTYIDRKTIYGLQVTSCFYQKKSWRRFKTSYVGLEDVSFKTYWRRPKNGRHGFHFRPI